MKSLKKIISENSRVVLVVLLLVLTVASFYFRNAQRRVPSKAVGGATTLAINPPSLNLAAGGTGTFSVTINPNGENVNAVELYIDFDPAVMRINSSAPGSFFSNSSVGAPQIIVNDLGSSGRLHYAIGFPLGSNFSSSSAGIVVTFSFSALQAGSARPITILNTGSPQSLISNTAAQNVLGTVNNGTITVTGGSGVTPGQPTPTRTPTRVPTSGTTPGQPTPTPIPGGVCSYFRN